MDYLTGQKLIKQKQFGKALKIFLDLLKNGNKEIGVLFYLGRIYSEFGDYKKSISYYEKCLTIDPNSINTLFNLAILKHNIGEINSAQKIYIKLINLNKNNIPSYFGLYTLNQSFISDKYYQNMIELLESDEINIYEKSLINYLLSKKEKNNNNYQKEIEYLDNFHSMCFKSNFEYNNQSEFYYKKIISKFYNKIEFDNININNKKHNSPLFIIGLPRSGSTLIESILTSEDLEIKSFGESNFINMSILQQIGSEIYNKDFILENFKFKIDFKKIYNSVLERYSQSSFDNDKKLNLFIDKSLENFHNIEIILKIFPKAKFLHTFRNSKDAVISIYQSMLSELSWTHKIEDILDYVDSYKNIINYFKKKYPEKIMDIDLEELTTESEKISKKIFNFCELKWTSRVLDFYKRDNLFSKTISSTQIRKKISSYNKFKYKEYFYLLEKFKNKYPWVDVKN